MRACFGVHVCAHCLVGRCSSLLEESRCLHPSDGVEHAWAPQRMGDREVNQIFRHADADDDQKVRVVRENPRVRARARLCVCVCARAVLITLSYFRRCILRVMRTVIPPEAQARTARV